MPQLWRVHKLEWEFEIDLCRLELPVLQRVRHPDHHHPLQTKARIVSDILRNCYIVKYLWGSIYCFIDKNVAIHVFIMKSLQHRLSENCKN